MVGKQDDFLLLLFVPDDDSTQDIRTVFLGLIEGKLYELVGDDVAVLRGNELFEDPISRTLPYARDEENLVFGPEAKEAVVTVPPIHYHNGTRSQRDVSGMGDFMFFAL